MNKTAGWRVLAWAFVLGAVALAAAVGASYEGLAPERIWLGAVGACALAVVGATARGPFRTSGVLAAAFLLGFAAQLSLTEPLWFAYVHFPPRGLPDIAAWLVIGAQALAALVGLGAAPWRDGPRVVRALGPVRTLIFLALTALCSISVMRYVGDLSYSRFAKQALTTGLFVAINFASLFAFARRLPAAALASVSASLAEQISLPGAEERVRPRDRAFVWAMAAFTFAFSLLMTVFVFQGMPHVEDEVAYLFQAKTFAHGALAVHAPPEAARAAFDYYLFDVRNGQWFAVTMPGWPIVLAPWTLIGASWLVNPLLAGVAILLSHRLACRLASRGHANVLALLMATSPWLAGLGGSLMTHVLTLCTVTGAWLCLLKAREESMGKGLGLALLGGALLGLLFLTRPFEGVIIGGLTGLWMLGRLRSVRGLSETAAYGAGCAAVGGLIFPFNLALTGKLLKTPLDFYIDNLWGVGRNRLGFGPDIGPPKQWGGLDLQPGHSPWEATIYLQHNAVALNVELFGWAIGSLALIWALLVWGRITRPAAAMLAVIATVLTAHFFYWFSASFFVGPRYWYLVFFPCIFLSALGAHAAGVRLKPAVADGPSRVGASILLLSLAAVVCFAGWRASTKYFGYNHYHADYRALSHNPALRGALVFVKAENDDEFGAALTFDRPDLSGPSPIFLRSHGAQADRQAATAFPGRPVFTVEGRSKTNAKARVVAGPLNGSD